MAIFLSTNYFEVFSHYDLSLLVHSIIASFVLMTTALTESRTSTRSLAAQKTFASMGTC